MSNIFAPFTTASFGSVGGRSIGKDGLAAKNDSGEELLAEILTAFRFHCALVGCQCIVKEQGWSS